MDSQVGLLRDSHEDDDVTAWWGRADNTGRRHDLCYCRTRRLNSSGFAARCQNVRRDTGTSHLLVVARHPAR